MRAGTLRHNLTLQSQTRASDGAGGATLTWTDVATVPAAIQPLVGQERFEAHKLNPKLSHAVTIRYREGVKPGMRGKFGGRLFNIQSIENLQERNRELRMICEELVS